MVAAHLIPTDGDASWFIPIDEALPTGEHKIIPGQVGTRLILEAAGIFDISACPWCTAF
jgi:hypothetical protein